MQLLTQIQVALIEFVSWHTEVQALGVLDFHRCFILSSKTYLNKLIKNSEVFIFLPTLLIKNLVK